MFLRAPCIWQDGFDRINLAAVPLAAQADFSVISPNEWLVGEVPYTNAEVRFSATRAESKISKHLKTKIAEPIFLAERTTWLSGTPVTNVHLYFAPGYQVIAHY